MNDLFPSEDVVDFLKTQAEVYLLGAGAIRKYQDPITLASGLETSCYVDLKSVGLTYGENLPVLNLLELGILDVIEQKRLEGVKIKAIGGVAMGGLIWSAQLIYRKCFSDYQHFIFDKDAEGGSFEVDRGNRLERDVVNALIIEDVVTTGGSSLAAINELALRGINVCGVVPIIQRDDLVQIDAINGVPIYPLFKMSEFTL